MIEGAVATQEYFGAIRSGVPTSGRSSPPIIETVRPDAGSPGHIDGIAGLPGGAAVVIRVTIDGEELAGSPDEEMEGEHNEFRVEIPEGHEGKELKIFAERDSKLHQARENRKAKRRAQKQVVKEHLFMHKTLNNFTPAERRQSLIA